LSPAEIEVLQQLAERRATLDQRASALDQQQIVLQAAEKRIDEKIAELQKLQKSIEADVAKQNQQDDARTQSLVKIYETMKPQEAAPILAQLDMPIALGVLTKMKERSTAAVLAAMDPARAQAITAALAQHRDPTAPGAVPAGKP
jgi:flagellar motility protein MotE (MotC chaperone)